MTINARRSPLKTTVERQGQKYVDEPVYKTVSKANRLALAVNAAVRAMAPQQPAPRIHPIIVSITGYDRYRLRWVNPASSQ